MKSKRLLLAMTPATLMIGTIPGLSGVEFWLAGLATTPEAFRALGRFGLALPYLVAALFGVVFLFAARGSARIRSAGIGVAIGGMIAGVIGIFDESRRVLALMAAEPSVPLNAVVDWVTISGCLVAMGVALFGLKVALKGDLAFASASPSRVLGKRAIHGTNVWMSMARAKKLFASDGGIVVGEAYRPDQDGASRISFVPRNSETWGQGGKAPLLGFDTSFGSTHGLVFAGSGGFKTTSVVIPTATRFSGSLVVLDPSTEIAPMVTPFRVQRGQTVYTLDPRSPEFGFNVLDWIGRHGSAPEEDIASVAAWLMSERPRITSGSDDFFRTMAEQLITAIIADVVLSRAQDETDDRAVERHEDDAPLRSGCPSLRMVRQRLAQPEETLKEKLTRIHESTTSRFVRENVAPFINMTPQTFSGVYATATKETHWLSYDNYAALVSGNSFETSEIADGTTTIFINIDLSTLENHPGLARVVIGALLKAVYNQKHGVAGRVLFLLDEAARLGYMRIIETARDAGRKFGITLLLLFQSLGQMREAFGGRDATSKWFESASWVSFSAINDPETAEYISRRCGVTTVEVDQISRSSNGHSVGRSRSKQLSSRPLILPHEVTQMRTDEQIVFTAGNPPLRCGRAIWFRRADMRAVIKPNRFHK
ncbi:Ti-type conjugative transfer system protein TraG [Devosia sp. Naph2]|uniref:Ti-type conjugative transfer system protein TraG n=1 Tax=Devosia polycyclovorans TaxID=3345148 RepID=UPI0035CF1243